MPHLPRSRGWDVLVVGGAVTDYLARGPRLPGPGEGVTGGEFQVAPGGKGANQAVAAARLGARVALVTCVGADARGDAIVERLDAEGVDVTYVRRDASTPTGVTLVHVGARGEKQTLSVPGATRHLDPAAVAAAAPALRGARIALLQLEPPLETVAAAVGLARDAGVPVVLDPAPAIPLPAELLTALRVIRPNAGEAEVLTGVRVDGRASAHAAAARLIDWGAQAAVVEAGDAGDLAVWDGGECWVPRFSVESVDTTGAGDAFAAALAVLLADGRPLAEATRFASAAAALTTTQVGAQAALPRRDAVEALLARAGNDRHASSHWNGGSARRFARRGTSRGEQWGGVMESRGHGAAFRGERESAVIPAVERDRLARSYDWEGFFGGMPYDEPVRRASFAGIGPRGYRRSDERIAEDVCDALTRHPGIDATDVEVDVDRGEVSLGGRVSDRQSRWLAEDVAASISGVHDVVNRIKLAHGA